MHIYFASPNKTELELIKEEGGTHVLVSFADRNCERLLERALELGFRVMIDSGAYSVFTGASSVTIEDYAAMLRDYGMYAEVYVNLDVCTDAEQTMRNQIWLEEHGLNPLPVYHFGEPSWVLEWLLSRGYTYIGLGNSVLSCHRPEVQFRDWVYKTTIEHPNVRFHGFAVGALVPKLMRLYSADSTSWLAGARYGRQIGKFGAIEGRKYGLFWTREELIRHNIRALLWQQKNITPCCNRQLALNL